MSIFIYNNTNEANQVTASEDFISNQEKPLETATFAGGCFWCVEAPFEKTDGVIEVVSGYTGGQEAHPTHEDVSSGKTGHVEAIRMTYDPEIISYEKLLDIFWRQIDPTDAHGSFVDRGPQYRSVIFYHSETQKQLATASKKQIGESGRFDKPMATQILKYDQFYPAEDYHQDYYKKNPMRYKYYRHGSGRDQFIEKAWKDEPEKIESTAKTPYTRPSNDELKEKLSPLEYSVTQKDGTEPPFNNKYWNNKKDGIYVDIVSGEPLFSSTDKFKSGTGWPSFARPISPDTLVEKQDKSLFTTRTEVRSRDANSHLGHLFDDGPQPMGLRYCINSASLKFIPKKALEEEGYGEFIKLFE